MLKPLFQHCPRSVWPRLLICEVTHDDTHQLAELREAFLLLGRALRIVAPVGAHARVHVPGGHADRLQRAAGTDVWDGSDKETSVEVMKAEASRFETFPASSTRSEPWACASCGCFAVFDTAAV